MNELNFRTQAKSGGSVMKSGICIYSVNLGGSLWNREGCHHCYKWFGCNHITISFCQSWQHQYQVSLSTDLQLPVIEFPARWVIVTVVTADTQSTVLQSRNEFLTAWQQTAPLLVIQLCCNSTRNKHHLHYVHRNITICANLQFNSAVTTAAK